jgi:hypothetical protein
MGSEAGIALKKTLLDGKPFQKILDHARKTHPWIIVLGGSASTARRRRPGSAATPRTFSAPRPAMSSSPRVWRCHGSTCAPRRACAGRPKPRSG